MRSLGSRACADYLCTATPSPRSLAAWSTLRAVDVSENPRVCGVQWLLDVLEWQAKHSDGAVEEEGGEVGEALCKWPAQLLHGRALRSLSEQDIGCAVAWDSTQKQAVIGAISIVVIAVIFLLYHFRRRVQDALKDYRWNNRAISRKEHEYQKTRTT